MFDDIYINQISNSNFVLLKKNGNNLTKYIFDTPILNMPFGIEEYKNKYIINIEFDNNITKKFYDDISEIDNYFRCLNSIESNNNNIIDLSNKSYYPIINNRRNDCNSLMRTHIKKNRNKIITICKNDSKEISIFDIDKKQKAIFELELNNLWVFNDKYGILTNINKIILC